MRTFKELNTLLATVAVTAAHVKARHWFVTGMHFRSAHVLFDDIWQDLSGATDTIAETVRVLGGQPLHTFEQWGNASVVDPTSLDGDVDYRAEDMIRHTRDELTAIVDIINQSVRVNMYTDPTVDNDLTAISSKLRHWLLFLNGMINYEK